MVLVLQLDKGGKILCFLRKKQVIEPQVEPDKNLLIDVKNLSKIYNEGKENEVRALDNISLEVPWGEFFMYFRSVRLW